MILSNALFSRRAQAISRSSLCSASFTEGISDFTLTVLMRIAFRNHADRSGWSAPIRVISNPPVQKKTAPHVAAPLKSAIPLLHVHADIVVLHVGATTESVLVIVEVDADRLPLVRGQVIRH